MIARRIPILIAFAIAMAFAEAAVVVDLEKAFFGGHVNTFPLQAIEWRYYWIEVAREAATVVMLVTVALLAARGGWERFFAFALAFGVWDLAYYAWLRVLIGWPATLVDWDVLFLIPIAWIGPVIAPVLIAAYLAALGAIGLRAAARGAPLDVRRADTLVFGLGTVLLLTSFIMPVARELVAGGLEAVGRFVPSGFDSISFSLGFFLYLAAGADIIRRSRARLLPD